MASSYFTAERSRTSLDAHSSREAEARWMGHPAATKSHVSNSRCGAPDFVTHSDLGQPPHLPSEEELERIDREWKREIEEKAIGVRAD